MTFDIKLKTGFFRTQWYFLTISRGQIVLTPQAENANKRVVIEARDLQAVYLSDDDEFEIITAATIYTGNFTARTNLKEVAYLLGKEFGEKLIN